MWWKQQLRAGLLQGPGPRRSHLFQDGGAGASPSSPGRDDGGDAGVQGHVVDDPHAGVERPEHVVGAQVREARARGVPLDVGQGRGEGLSLVLGGLGVNGLVCLRTVWCV